MLKGFEEYTVDLTAQEKREVLPVILAFIKGMKPGKENAKTNTEIGKYLATQGIKAGGPKVRKLISYIETHGLVPRLMASGTGYHIAVSVRELQEYIQSLQGRYNIIGQRIEKKSKYIEGVIERNRQQEESGNQ